MKKMLPGFAIILILSALLLIGAAPVGVDRYVTAPQVGEIIAGSNFTTAAAVALGYVPATNSNAGIVAALKYTPVTNSNAGVVFSLGYTPATNTYAGVVAALKFPPATNHFSGDILTNNGMVWLATNLADATVPDAVLPNGSILTGTNGCFYVMSNSIWVQK